MEIFPFSSENLEKSENFKIYFLCSNFASIRYWYIGLHIIDINNIKESNYKYK